MKRPYEMLVETDRGPVGWGRFADRGNDAIRRFEETVTDAQRRREYVTRVVLFGPDRSIIREWRRDVATQ